MKNIYAVVIFFTFQYLTAQVGGEAVYKFLNVSSSPTQIALGGVHLTNTTNVNQLLWNPSGFSEQNVNKIGLNYTPYIDDISFGEFVYSHKLPKEIGYAGITAKYVDYGSFDEANEIGEITGTFSSKDLAVGLMYAYYFKKIHTTLGTHIKYINSTIATFSSSALLFDFGLTYKRDGHPFSMAFVLRNTGWQIQSYDGTQESLPFQFAFGMSSVLKHVPIKWYVSLNDIQQWQIAYSNPTFSQTDLDGLTTEENISNFENAFRHFIVGAELFTGKKFNVRIGYNYRRAKELRLLNTRTFSGLSLGFGLNLKKFSFNYANAKLHPASNTHSFGLILNL